MKHANQNTNRAPGNDPAGEGRKRSFPQSFFLCIGSIGPLGHLPASGTVSVAVAGIPLYWLMVTYLSSTVYAAVTVIFILLAMGIHHIGDRILGESDSRKLVWDELAGYFVAMFLMGWDWRWVAIGFFVERAIDIVKVPPANVIDRKMHSGVGVVLDDVVAGVYTCILLHLAKLVF